MDLGRFYDLTAAKNAAEEVKARTHAYKAAYIRAYHNLKAARQVELDAVASMVKAFDFERLDRRVKGKRNKNAELSRRSLDIIEKLRETVLE